MLASYRFDIETVSHTASLLAPVVAQATGFINKQDDIKWALKEVLGNIRHAPNHTGLVEVHNNGNIILTNCAIGFLCTNATSHGLGISIARSLGAEINLSFIERNYGCWQAITHIRWDFDVLVQPIDIDLSKIPEL